MGSSQLTTPLNKKPIPSAREKIKEALAQTANMLKNQNSKSNFVATNSPSFPQINSPRILTNNLPQTDLNSVLSQIPDFNTNQGPLTILPPRVVSPGGAAKYEKDPSLALRKGHKNYKNSAKLKYFRRLQSPYLMPGPGYMDVGSNGFSPLSFAMMRPDGGSMSPFVPRNTPPPPIRIQLQDPLQDTYKRNILSRSESRVNKKEISDLTNTLKDLLGNLDQSFQSVKDIIEPAFESIKEKTLKVQEHRESVEKSTKLMNEQIKKMSEEALKNKQRSNLVNLINDLTRQATQVQPHVVERTMQLKESENEPIMLRSQVHTEDLNPIKNNNNSLPNDKKNEPIILEKVQPFLETESNQNERDDTLNPTDRKQKTEKI